MDKNRVIEAVKSLVGNIFGEVAGDLVESGIKWAHSMYEKNKMKADFEKIISKYNICDEDTTIINKIVKEIRKYNETNLSEVRYKKWQKVKQKLSDFFGLNQNEVTVDFIEKLGITVLFEHDYSGIFARSATFNECSEEKQRNYIGMIEELVELYRRASFSNIPKDLQLVTQVICGSIEPLIEQGQSLKEITEQTHNDLQKLLKFLEYNSNGEINWQTISLSQSPFKYVLNACPGCGYDGPMIYVDDKTNTMHCAACGCSYHALEYAEPELWKKCEEKFNGIDGKVDGLKSLLMEISKEQKATDKQIEDLKKLVGKNYQVLIDLVKDCNAKSENLDKALMQLKEGLESAVTQQYLENALNGQNEKMKGYIDQAAENANNIVKQCFETYMGQISDQLRKNNEELEQLSAQNKAEAEARKKDTATVLEAIAQVNAKNAEYNEILCEKMDSLGQTINEIGKYVMKKTEATQQNTEVILKYVQQLCTKEMLDSMRDFLINSQSTLMSEMGDVRNEGALTRSEIAKIASRIDDVVEEWRERERVGDTKMKEFWENKIGQLKTDITIVSEQIRDLQASHDRDYACMITLEQENAQKIDMLAIQNMELAKSLEQLQAVCKANADMLKKNHELFVQARQNKLSLKGIQQISSSWGTSVQNCYDQMGETFKDETDSETDSKNKLSSIINKLNDTYESIKGAIDKAEVDFIDKLKELERRIVLYQHQDDCPRCGVPKAMEYTCNICGGHGEQDVAQLEVQDRNYVIYGDILMVQPVQKNDHEYEINFNDIGEKMEKEYKDTANINKIVINNSNVTDGAITICSYKPIEGLEQIVNFNVELLYWFENLKYFAIAIPSHGRCSYQIKGEPFFVGFKDQGVRLYGMQYVNKVEKKVLCQLSEDNNEWYKYGFIQSAME